MIQLDLFEEPQSNLPVKYPRGYQYYLDWWVKLHKGEPITEARMIEFVKEIHNRKAPKPKTYYEMTIHEKINFRVWCGDQPDYYTRFKNAWIISHDCKHNIDY